MGKRGRPPRANSTGHAEIVEDRDGSGYSIVRHDCGQLDELESAAEHVRVVQESMERMIFHLREEHGITWQRIGDALGVTRQAARQRWGG